MKRYGNLYYKIYDIDNLLLADKIAQRGKKDKLDVIGFNKDRDINILILHEILKNKLFKTSKYHVFTLHDPKERVIYKLPFFPDRILHHAIMNILEPIFVSTFTFDTYNCIKNRGIHKALYNLNCALEDVQNTQYCLKLDIKKFYPNINHDILKKLLRKKFKDNDLLELLDEIVDSAPGVPIGNYLSQYFANFYLSYFDHWLKEELRIKYYFRYCDDLVILAKTKEELHIILHKIREYLAINLDLQIKENYQIFKVSIRGIDFVGYKSFHTHILLRKSIKKRYIKMLKYDNNRRSIVSYNGWLLFCNSINLQKKYEKFIKKES